MTTLPLANALATGNRRGGSRTAPTGTNMHRGVGDSMNRQYDPGLRRRRSIRLKGYDYAQSGAYFVTIVTQGRIPHFGEIMDGEMLLNVTGLSVAVAWEWLATRYPHVKLDEYVVMPNHLHGIIVMTDERRGGSRTAPTGRKPLGRLVAAFKTVNKAAQSCPRYTRSTALAAQFLRARHLKRR